MSKMPKGKKRSTLIPLFLLSANICLTLSGVPPSTPPWASTAFIGKYEHAIIFPLASFTCPLTPLSLGRKAAKQKKIEHGFRAVRPLDSSTLFLLRWLVQGLKW